MTGARYQWIILGYYEPNWWLENRGPCTNDQLIQALNGTLQTRVVDIGYNRNARTMADLTPDQFKFDLSLMPHIDMANRHFLGYAFDAVLTVTAAFQKLDKLLQQQKNCSTNFEDDSVWRDNCWRSQLINALQAVEIEGVTISASNRKFSKTSRSSLCHPGEDCLLDTVKLYVALPDKKLGPPSFILVDAKSGMNITWHGNGPPTDRIKRIERDQRISVMTYTVIAIISGTGIILATTFFVFNIIFRAHRFIRMSSPQLNNLIIVGCILSYISVLLMGIDSTLLGKQSSQSAMDFICAAIKDYRLFIIVGVLFAIDTVLLSSWQILDPLKIFKNISQKQTKDEDVVIVWIYEECRCRRRTIWIAMQFTFKGVLMVAGSRFAWKTRSVCISALNDSKYIGMSVYNVVLLSITTAVVGYFFEDQHEMAFVLTSIFILLCVTITLCLVFVPKFLEVAKDPSSRAKPQRAVLTAHKKSVDSSVLTHIRKLSTENEHFRSNLAKCNKLIDTLLSHMDDKGHHYEIILQAYRTGQLRPLQRGFDNQWRQGDCPVRWLQLGNECLYFNTYGKQFSWNDVEQTCTKRISRYLAEDQVKLTRSTVRPILLNTPEKRTLLQALADSYGEDGYAIQLPRDYDNGCKDAIPAYCDVPDKLPIEKCVETNAKDTNFCVKQTDCNKKYARLACEFTLPGLIVGFIFLNRKKKSKSKVPAPVLKRTEEVKTVTIDDPTTEPLMRSSAVPSSDLREDVHHTTVITRENPGQTRIIDVTSGTADA
ncbi:unnamed protein product [Didymodactylos carnosus]|nr:unnamed protein product [Didymodactylos carnosus]CAF4027979.1 unnamed protein product [Didymodactylos carnosus]